MEVSVFFPDNKIPYQIRPDIVLSDGISESIFVEIDKDIFQMGKNIILGVIYRPTSTDLPSFNDALSLMLSELTQQNKYCYIMGDYNINLLNHETHQHTTNFVDQLLEN